MSSGTSPRRNVLPGLARRCCHEALPGSAPTGFVRPSRTHHDFIIRSSPAESSALISELTISIIWKFVASHARRNNSRPASDLSKELVQTHIWNPDTFELRSLVDILSSSPLAADSYAASSRPSINHFVMIRHDERLYIRVHAQLSGAQERRVQALFISHYYGSDRRSHSPSRNRTEKTHL